MREIQRSFDSKEEVADIVLKCDRILHSKGYRTNVKTNRIEFFQKLKLHELTPLISLIQGIGEGVVIFKKEPGLLIIRIRQKLYLYGFLTILIFATLYFILTMIKKNGSDLHPFLITGLIVIPLSLIGMVQNMIRTNRVYKTLNNLL